MRIDVNCFLGAYPFRRVPGTSPDAVLAAMDRVGIDEAWVTHLPGLFWRDPTAGNAWLQETAAASPRLRAVRAVHPGLAHWEEIVRAAADAGAPAVRADPMYYGLAPDGAEMRALAAACGAADVALLLSVQLEDGRQRHPHDVAGDLPPWAVRHLLRSDPRVRLVVTHADRPFVEEVHFGSTVAESARVWWDLCRIWGPPEDHLATLLETIGPARFVFGTGQPLRLPENALAKLDLLDLAPADRAAIEHGNARRAAGRT
ncbi:MAG TPA: amidohydrolase family protein [Gemmatimonadales bacterium]|nr:amidohydrolase family protein [Gemmatimonadales bacterium]